MSHRLSLLTLSAALGRAGEVAVFAPDPCSVCQSRAIVYGEQAICKRGHIVGPGVAMQPTAPGFALWNYLEGHVTLREMERERVEESAAVVVEQKGD